MHTYLVFSLLTYCTFLNNKNCQKCVEKRAILKMWRKLNYTHFLFVLLKQLPAALCVLTLDCI